MRRCMLFFLSLVCLANIGWMWREDPKIAEYMQQGYKAYYDGELNAALTAFERVLMLEVDNIEAMNLMGTIYEELNFPDKAEEKYLTTLKIDRDYLPAYYNLGFLYWNQGEKTKAIYYLQKRIKKGNPKDPWTIKAQTALKNIQASKSKDRQEIISQAISEVGSKRKEMVKKKAKIKPLLIKDKARHGLVYRTLDQLEQHQDVKEELKYSSKDLSKDQAQELFANGRELVQNGKYDEAIAVYDQALQITPGDSQIIKARVEAFMKAKQNSNNWK